jgi:hypothetical protein
VLTQAQVERAIETMARHERWPDMDLAADVLRRQAAALSQPTLVDLIDLVYRHLLGASGKQRLGDKTPHYFAIAPELATLYPDAKFIHLVRDGRDVAISWIDAGWQRYYEPGFEWPMAIAALDRDRTAYPDRVLEVRYEDLVHRPDEVARRICVFLGETFEQSMLDWQDRTELVASRDRHLHARLQQPLSDDAIAVWRHRLSGVECFAVESCGATRLRSAVLPARLAPVVRRYRRVVARTGAVAKARHSISAEARHTAWECVFVKHRREVVMGGYYRKRVAAYGVRSNAGGVPLIRSAIKRAVVAPAVSPT